MKRFFHLPDFLRYAIYLLANLAINDQMKEEIGQEGGIQIIIKCMTAHNKDKGLIDNACFSLGNLSFECEVINHIK